MTEPSHQLETSQQDFLEQANSKEKTFGHNKFQIEIENYKLKVESLEKELKTNQTTIEQLNLSNSNQKTEFEKLHKTFEHTKQTYENRISNLNVQYENLKKQLQEKAKENDSIKERYNLEYPKVTDLYNDIDKLKNDLHDISINKDSLQENFNLLNEKYETQNKKLESLSDLNEQLTNELNLQKSISQSFEKEIDILKKENINNMHKIEELDLALEEKDDFVKNNIQISKNIVIDTDKKSTTEIKPRIRLYGSRRRKN